MSVRLPRATDVVTDQDVELWVAAAVKATLPAFTHETKELLLFAMKEHEKVLEAQTGCMRKTIEAQSELMQRTIESQGRAMVRVVALGGMTALLSYLWHADHGELRGRSKWQLMSVYALGVVATIVATR